MVARVAIPGGRSWPTRRSPSAACAPSTAAPSPTDRKKLGFGRYFSDHFFATEFDRDNGWHLTRIEPMRPLQIDPAAICLHYGQEVFEGLKAYRGKDDGIYLFRWQKNAERLRNSCQRLMMETVDEEFFGRAVKALVLLEQDWIPQRPGCSLYIRPTLIATDPFLGVRPGRRVRLLHHRRARSAPTTPRASTRSASGSPRRTCARCKRRPRRGQDRRQLRPQPVRAEEGGRARLHPGALARRHRAPLGRGGGHDEHLLPHQGRGRSPRRSRGTILPGRDARQRASPSAKHWGITRHRAHDLHRRGGRDARSTGDAARRSSAPAPPRSSRRSACSPTRARRSPIGKNADRRRWPSASTTTSPPAARRGGGHRSAGSSGSTSSPSRSWPPGRNSGAAPRASAWLRASCLAEGLLPG